MTLTGWKCNSRPQDIKTSSHESLNLKYSDAKLGTVAAANVAAVAACECC